MDDSGVGKYKELFLKSANKLITQIKKILNSGGDPVLLHRLFHNLKGQVLFMDLTDIGGVCLKGEKIMEEVIKKNIPLDKTTKNTLKLLLEKIELDLKNYENSNR